MAKRTDEKCILPTRRLKVSASKPAYVVEWERYYGKVPAGLVVRHTCKEVDCYNINHLWVGKAAE